MENKLVQITEYNKNKKCILCEEPEINELHLGQFYSLENIYAHYYCVLFASKLEQNGNDDEGIWGFLVKDIKKEQIRGKKVKCTYCGKKGATSACVIEGCKSVYHLPCGVKNDAMQLFYDDFRSYCSRHRSRQRVPIEYQQSSSPVCCICHETLEPKPSITTLWAPCCKKNWLHRDCIQKMALAAGYYFKCPICKDGNIFREELKKQGIHIPDHDATWEIQPRDFTVQYRHCDADECKCPRGREYRSRRDGPFEWRIMRCILCGSKGVHVACSEKRVLHNSWQCSICSLTGNNFVNESETAEMSSMPGPSNQSSRKRSYSSGSEDEDDELVNKRIEKRPCMPAHKVRHEESGNTNITTSVSAENEKNSNQSHNSGGSDIVISDDDDDDDVIIIIDNPVTENIRRPGGFQSPFFNIANPVSNNSDPKDNDDCIIIEEEINPLAEEEINQSANLPSEIITGDLIPRENHTPVVNIVNNRSNRENSTINNNQTLNMKNRFRGNINKNRNPNRNVENSIRRNVAPNENNKKYNGIPIISAVHSEGASTCLIWQPRTDSQSAPPSSNPFIPNLIRNSEVLKQITDFTSRARSQEIIEID